MTALRNALALYYDDTNGRYPLLGTRSPWCGNLSDGSPFCMVVSRSISTPPLESFRPWSDFEQEIKPYIPGGIKAPIHNNDEATASRYRYDVFTDPTGTQVRTTYWNMTNCTSSGNPQPGFVPVSARIFAFPLERLPITVDDYFQWVENCPYWQVHSMSNFKVFGLFIP